MGKYVDKVNMVLPTIGWGLRWTENWDLTWKAEAWEEDSGPGARSAARRTVDLIREKASTITKGIRFTSDLPEDHPNGKAPMLDTQVWIQRGQERNGKWEGDV